jgi:pimeloyl-ACP methyl ester carboxylesterase
MAPQLLRSLIVCLLTTLAACARADDGTFTAGTIKLHYTEQGSGEPLILLNGIFGSANKTWGYMSDGGFGLMEPLSERYHVIALDTRGQGESDKPHDPKLYGMETVRDVIRLMDHLKIARAHVLGWSMGGGIAGCLLVHYPQRIASAILVSPRLVYHQPESLHKETELFLDALRHKEKRAHIIISLTPPNRPKPTHKEADAMAEAVLKNEDTLALAAWLSEHDRELAVTKKEMESNRVPVLVVCGSLETEYGEQERMKEIAADLHGNLRVIQGAHHGDCPRTEEFQEAVLNFLHKHSTPNQAH